MRRVQPLKARAHPLFQYAGPIDPTCESEADLPRLEVRAQVASVLKTGVEIEAALNDYPSPRSLAHNPHNVCFSPFPTFSGSINAYHLPHLDFCFALESLCGALLPDPLGGPRENGGQQGRGAQVEGVEEDEGEALLGLSRCGARHALRSV
ncbi:hypothetical protein BAE44_0011212 [Dichanthelium oligosanthes]|uniref:Uncharacterized protein n=1 Tax=Dichanthelium oligosanthes TaxID=888268 RepID=A0A1E5VRN6_9POAL|nr:hypothetical protein BAE44_0011212 [Dichanthelium oligosanthes]